MSNQDEVLPDNAVNSQHQTIMQGGKIEEFADALGRFCRVEGWKKLKDEKWRVVSLSQALHRGQTSFWGRILRQSWHGKN